MKLLGAGLIWTSLIFVATVYSSELKRRVIILSETSLMIYEMKIQLEYLNMPVYDMIDNLSKKDSLTEIDFLRQCRELLSQGKDFPLAWKTSVLNAMHYKMNEKTVLLQLGSNLGTSNKENQIEMLQLHKIAFDEFIKTAKDKEAKYGKMSITLAALTGCMFFVTAI